MQHRTGIEDYYIIKNNKKLRYGYTTGSCAAAAAKGAAIMLLSGSELHHVRLMTPKGIELDLLLHCPMADLREEDLQNLPEKADLQENASPLDGYTSPSERYSMTCAVQKDGGDDPDATNGILVYASVFRTDTGKIEIDGGPGVGRVTRNGMQQPVGAAAINPVPLQMIKSEVEQVCADFEYEKGLKVVISIPEGEAIAGKTFNPRLGIEGGISVLGTSGIVVPMSESALIASIELEMKMLISKGYEYLIVTPGNYGETFTKNEMTIDLSSSMKCSNYVGETLDMAVNLGVKGILFVAHIGKFIKVAGGIMNTHSRDADCRAELMAAFALKAGADRDTAMRILGSITTDEALEIMEEAGVRKKAMELAAGKIRYYLQHRVGEAIPTEAVLFSGSFGYLTQTSGAEGMIRRLQNGLQNRQEEQI